MHSPAAWPEIDPLSGALQPLRVQGLVYCRSEVAGCWGISLPPLDDCLMFHVVQSGRCWLAIDGEPRRLLETGDFALVTQAVGHRLFGDPKADCPDLFTLERQPLGPHYETLRIAGFGDSATLLCGALRYGDPLANQLLAALPKVLQIDATAAADAPWLRASLELLDAEAREAAAGSAAVISRLADILVVQAIRAWISTQAGDGVERGWLAALQDPHIGRALGLIHREPGGPLDLARLARSANLSRSAFAARFAALVGVPPVDYLTRWRMRLAASWLEARSLPVATVAERVGYQSEAAFGKAFKRVLGTAPGAWRGRIDPGWAPRRAADGAKPRRPIDHRKPAAAKGRLPAAER